MRFASIRQAAKARRRFINVYDPQRSYVYVTKRRLGFFEVQIFSRNDVFLSYL